MLDAPRVKILIVYHIDSIDHGSTPGPFATFV